MDIKIEKMSEDVSYVKIKYFLAGVQILNYYKGSKNFKRIKKEGSVPLLRENISVSDKFKELIINDDLSFYFFDDNKTRFVRMVRVGCMVGDLKYLWNMKKKDLQILFKALHEKTSEEEFNKILIHRETIRKRLEKVPYSKKWNLKKGTFFKRIIEG